MESPSEQSLTQSTLAKVRESNEARLDALASKGVSIVIDGPALVSFLFDRALACDSARDFRRSWILNVAGLLNEIEATT
jgi:hypothetical protein